MCVSVCACVCVYVCVCCEYKVIVRGRVQGGGGHTRGWWAYLPYSLSPSSWLGSHLGVSWLLRSGGYVQHSHGVAHVLQPACVCAPRVGQ